MDSSSADRPTNVRFLTLGLCIAMAMLLYLDRYALSPVTSTLLTELQVTKEQLGRTVFFAFFFAYALCQVPAGWLSDTFGARRMLALYVAVWSLATISMGFVNGLAAIFFVRFLLGVSQAGAYPTAASVIKRWFPYTSRGRASSAVSMGGRAGGLLAFAITPSLLLLVGALFGWETGRWRIVFAFYGALGLVWVVVFAWLYRDSPREHPWCNAEEIELIAPAVRVTGVPLRRVLPPLTILTSKEVLLMCVIGFCVDVGWVFLVSWLPQYLIETHGEYIKTYVGDEQVVAGRMTALTGLAGMIGTLLGGLATDRLVVRFGPIWGRRLPGVIAGVVVAGLYLVAPLLPNVWLFVGAMAAISLSIDFCLGAMWATYQDIGGRHVASVLGVGNMSASFGAAAFTWYAGSLADHKQWNAVFLLAAAAMVIAAIGWLLIDPTHSVEPHENA
ncbi:MAG TPA: MFS transporter [Planctomycetaceae bacterium]|nr:MFS transporter [Planctomycetaceae bacterium]